MLARDKLSLWLNISVSLEVRFSKCNICKSDLVENLLKNMLGTPTLGTHQKFQANKIFKPKFKISHSNFLCDPAMVLNNRSSIYHTTCTGTLQNRQSIGKVGVLWMTVQVTSINSIDMYSLTWGVNSLKRQFFVKPKNRKLKLHKYICTSPKKH